MLLGSLRAKEHEACQSCREKRQTGEAFEVNAYCPLRSFFSGFIGPDFAIVAPQKGVFTSKNSKDRYLFAFLIPFEQFNRRNGLRSTFLISRRDAGGMLAKCPWVHAD